MRREEEDWSEFGEHGRWCQMPCRLEVIPETAKIGLTASFGAQYSELEFGD